MKINEAKKIMKLETTKERENAFYTLYDVDGQKEVLEQFQAKVTALKLPKRASKAKVQEQYINLLELVLEYSHAIFFLYSKDRINKNINAFKKMALAVIREENVIKAFKQFNRLYDYREQNQEPQQQEEQIIIDNDCLALEHIENLKKELDSDITVEGGGSVEDKKAYMKFAIIALATGATASEITDTGYFIEDRVSIYDNKYISKLVEELREYSSNRTASKINKETQKREWVRCNFSERGIRNGVDKLKLNLSVSLWERIGSKATHCRNFYHLSFLYAECIATQKREQKV